MIKQPTVDVLSTLLVASQPPGCLQLLDGGACPSSAALKLTAASCPMLSLNDQMTQESLGVALLVINSESFGDTPKLLLLIVGSPGVWGLVLVIQPVVDFASCKTNRV